MKNKANLIIVILSIIILVMIIAIVNIITDNTEENKSDEIDTKIKSKILKEVIENEWKSDYKFGSKESTFDEYDIYFDEGIEVKTVDKKIYNIVFTEKYKKNIVNNIKLNDTLEDIISELGEPDFGGKSINLIGYKFNDIYIFFNGKQASIYRNEGNSKLDTSIFTNSYRQKQDIIDELLIEWEDFDNYTETKNNDILQYALISYANKGLRITLNNDTIELMVYNNCNIKIPENDAYKIVTKNKNLIYEVETERQNSIHNREFAYREYNSTMNNLPPDFELDVQPEQQYNVIQSKVFIPVQLDYNIEGKYKLAFVSIDGNHPNSETDVYVSSDVWMDDYNIIYSIKNKGIYLYNVRTREKTIVKEGNEEFILHGITNDNNLIYDNTEIKINL